ncbi:hypothetical protein BHE74_00042598 [Ensete ventricosum]|nr:hypothetical protein BHE74_00042598 [Ensete ventricosum]
MLSHRNRSLDIPVKPDLAHGDVMNGSDARMELSNYTCKLERIPIRSQKPTGSIPGRRTPNLDGYRMPIWGRLRKEEYKIVRLSREPSRSSPLFSSPRGIDWIAPCCLPLVSPPLRILKVGSWHQSLEAASLFDMISSVKQSSATIGFTDLVGRKSPSLRPRIASVAPLSAIRRPSLSLLTRKPLYLASPEGFGFGFRDGIVSAAKPRGLAFKCEAYEADGSESVEVSHQESRSATAQKVKIGIYFATWWALNVVFNIYNKKVLNAFPYPWLTSTLSLATGSLMMLISWATRIAEAPKTDFNFWKALAPVRQKLHPFRSLVSFWGL